MDRLEHRKGKAVLHFQEREGKPLAGKNGIVAGSF